MFLTVVLITALVLALFCVIVYLFVKTRTKNRKRVDTSQATRW